MANKNKTLKTRIQLKHETEANWSKATNFIPLAGEVIIYEPDEYHTQQRVKIGDGITNVNDLTFSTDICWKLDVIEDQTLYYVVEEQYNDEGESIYCVTNKTFNVYEEAHNYGDDWTTDDTYEPILEVYLSADDKRYGESYICVKRLGPVYVRTDELLSPVGGMIVPNSFTKTGEQVYITQSSNVIYYTPLSVTDSLQIIYSNLNTLTGQKTEYKGEIFNDYNNNEAVSQYATAIGSTTRAGLRGWAIQDYGEEDWGDKYLRQILYIAPDAESDLALGDTISLILTSNRWNVYTIYDIYLIDDRLQLVLNENISLANLGIEQGGYVCKIDKPEWGDTDLGLYAHAEGWGTQALYWAAHAEGMDTKALAQHSHTEGRLTQATGVSAHAEGLRSNASGSQAHAEGRDTVASGAYGSHAEGYKTQALSRYSHAEGRSTQAGTTNDADTGGLCAHAEGNATKALGDFSHAEGDATEATGQHSHAEGQNTIASGRNSHAEGYYTKAEGAYTHAEGMNTQANGENAHAEGVHAIAKGTGSHAEGEGTQALHRVAHAEGYSTIADGIYSHAEGNSTHASGSNSHAEGQETAANGIASHAEGHITIAQGDYSHTEGALSVAEGKYAHAEGYETQALGDMSHAEGKASYVEGDYGHAEGIETEAHGLGAHAEGNTSLAFGDHSHAEGKMTTANGASSHTEGINTVTHGNGAHAEGYSTNRAQDLGITTGSTISVIESTWATDKFALAKASSSHVEGQNGLALGEAAHAEGANNKAKGTSSHAEGRATIASGTHSHAEGFQGVASNTAAHAEGFKTKASGTYSHAEGNQTTASGDYSHAGGLGTIAASQAQTVIGKYNKNNDGALLIVGNGTGNNDWKRSNAFEVLKDGRATVAQRPINHIDVVNRQYAHELAEANKQAIDSVTNSLTRNTHVASGNPLLITDMLPTDHKIKLMIENTGFEPSEYYGIPIYMFSAKTTLSSPEAVDSLDINVNRSWTRRRTSSCCIYQLSESYQSFYSDGVQTKKGEVKRIKLASLQIPLYDTAYTGMKVSGIVRAKCDASSDEDIIYNDLKYTDLDIEYSGTDNIYNIYCTIDFRQSIFNEGDVSVSYTTGYYEIDALSIINYDPRWTDANITYQVRRWYHPEMGMNYADIESYTGTRNSTTRYFIVDDPDMTITCEYAPELTKQFTPIDYIQYGTYDTPEEALEAGEITEACRVYIKLAE